MSHSVFLTGVTGFVGKVVLESLVRQRKKLKISKIYVLIRDKKSKPAQERFHHDVASSPCFSRLSSGWESLVEVVSADLTELTLPDALTQKLQQELTHVIHCAASVAFDLPVAEAAAANITSALNLMKLAQGCRHLQSFVDVSTAYVTPHTGDHVSVPEALVPLALDPESTYQKILAGEVNETQLMQDLGFPNTYTLTKCLSEHLLNKHKGQVPLAIVRPSIISASWQDPHPNWIDSYAAFAGFVGLIGAGLLRCVMACDDTILDIVPCDEVSRRIVKTAFVMDNPPLIQHVVSGVHQGCRIDNCIAGIENYFQRHPIRFWPKMTKISNGLPSLDKYHFKDHVLPTRAMMLGAKATGRSRQIRELQKVLSKIEYLNDAFPYFTHHTFRFEMSEGIGYPDFDPKQYIEKVCRGVHHYLMRHTPSEMVLGGRVHRHPKSDLRWALQQPVGNWAVRLAAYIVRKGLRKTNEHITFDRNSFEQAIARIPVDDLVLLVPSHRSYMDFLLCSYMVFAYPELNLAIPHIAAANDFARLPFLGWFFKQTHAFYIQRGTGQPDPDLTRRIQGLVEQGQSLEFFVEGTRSRTRQFLPPKRGILRAIQSTEVPATLLPVSLSYDRVPEERAFVKELKGEGKPRMKMRTLLKWGVGLVFNKVKLGRIHVVCGEPLRLKPDTDVYALSHEIMRELQDKTVVSTFHLQCFVDQHPAFKGDVAWLTQAIQKRGGQVVDSGLQARVEPVIEKTMRYHWMHYFYPDILALMPEHPAIEQQVAQNAYLEHLSEARLGPNPDDTLLDLLYILFEPITQEYLTLLRLARADERLSATAETYVKGYSDVRFLPVVKAVLRTLCQREIMMQKDNDLIPGPNWSQLDEMILACQWRALKIPQEIKS